MQTDVLIRQAKEYLLFYMLYKDGMLFCVQLGERNIPLTPSPIIHVLICKITIITYGKDPVFFRMSKTKGPHSVVIRGFT